MKPPPPPPAPPAPLGSVPPLPARGEVGRCCGQASYGSAEDGRTGGAGGSSWKGSGLTDESSCCLSMLCDLGHLDTHNLDELSVTRSAVRYAVYLAYESAQLLRYESEQLTRSGLICAPHCTHVSSSAPPMTELAHLMAQPERVGSRRHVVASVAAELCVVLLLKS